MNLEIFKKKHYKVNQDFHFILQDALKVGVSEKEN